MDPATLNRLQVAGSILLALRIGTTSKRIGFYYVNIVA